VKTDDKSSSTTSEAVGFCKPPKATRFKKGVSGNPAGRPRGRLNVATVFIKTLHEKVIVNERGRKKTVTKLEAALTQMVNKAASGDLRALHQLLELARDAEARQNTPGSQTTALNELDREVIQGILKRFEPEESQSSDTEEAGNAECS
jgi:hypothetical protein